MATVKVHFRPYKGPGGKYRAVFRYKGLRRSRVVATQKEGREWAAEEVKRLIREQRRGRALMFSAASNEYLEDCSTWMAAQTVNEKFSHYTSLASFVGGDFDMQRLTIEAARKYYRRIQFRVSAKTANNHVKNLKALWNWHEKEGRIRSNPWRHVVKNPGEEHQEYVPPPEDVAAVLMAASPWEQDYLNIILKTGCRASDPRRLTWDAVNFEREFVAFWTKKRRGGEKKYRKIHMPKGSKLYEILHRRWESRDRRSPFVFTNPTTGTGYGRQTWPFKHMLKDYITTKVKPFTLKSLRHYVALRLADSGKVSLPDIQRILGHENATTTDIYLKGLRGDTQKAASVLDEDDLIKETNSKQNGAQSGAQMAEKEGFEPSNEFPHYTLSRRAPSASSATSPVVLRTVLRD